MLDPNRGTSALIRTFKLHLDPLRPKEMELDKQNKIVEIAVTTDGDRIPLGLMNAEQALELPDQIEIEVSHPEHEAGSTEIFISKDELAEHLTAEKP